jgi:hypothetical protein
VGAAIHVGGVEEVDAGVERGVDDHGRALLIEPAAEVVAAEAHHGHGQATEFSSLHG